MLQIIYTTVFRVKRGINITFLMFIGGSCSRYRMVVGVTTSNAISMYHHQSCEFESRSWRVALDTILCDKIYQ